VPSECVLRFQTNRLLHTAPAGGLRAKGGDGCRWNGSGGRVGGRVPPGAAQCRLAPPEGARRRLAPASESAARLIGTQAPRPDRTDIFFKLHARDLSFCKLPFLAKSQRGKGHNTNYVTLLRGKGVYVRGTPHTGGKVGHKSHDPFFHKKYMEAGVMTFVTHCTRERVAKWRVNTKFEMVIC